MRGRMAAVLVLAATAVTGTRGGAAGLVAEPSLLFDDALARVAVAVPGFAGTWLEGETLVVALTRPGDAAAGRARRHLAHVLGRPDLASRPLAVRRARWSFAELHGWHRAVSPLILALPGSVVTDVDERDNVVRIGVEDVERARRDVVAVLTANDVPPEAVAVEQADPVRLLSSLRDAHAPARGGLEIGYRGGTNPLRTCTYGFGAMRGLQAGFVTASHCTATQGGVEGTTYTQPTTGPVIGSEWLDPAYFTGGVCPAGRHCRYSDSAFAISPFNVEGPRFSDVMALGTIARPTGGTTAWNSRDMYYVTSKAAPLVGETVRKVGRTTGDTGGSVSETCENYNVSGLSIVQLTMLCQANADYLSQAGDSGGPVFTVTSGTDVALRGLHWGTGGVFSPITGIERNDELGPLRTCTAGAGC